MTTTPADESKTDRAAPVGQTVADGPGNRRGLLVPGRRGAAGMSRSDTDIRPPLPGECDPRYARERATLVQWLDTSRDHQRFVIEPGPARIWELSEQSLPTTDVTYIQRVLTRRKVYASAPFVGRPFGYYWWTAIDADGRGVAGEQVSTMLIDSGPLWNRYLMESDEMAPVRAYSDGWDDGYAAAKRKFTATEGVQP